MSIFAGTNGYLDDIPSSDVRPLRDRAARLHAHAQGRPDDDDPRARARCPTATRSPRRSPTSRPASQPTSSRRERVTMAGGQERILRRRIKSVQSTKKITRAMELIAASRIVKAQARVQAAQPYADGITEVVRDLQAAGARRRTTRCSSPRPETRRVGEVVIAADRGLCGALQLERDPRRRGRHPRAAARRAARHAIVTVGRKAEGYFRFRDFPIERVVRRVHADTPPTRTRAQVAAAVDRAVPSRASSTSCSSSTRGSSPPAARRS